jgi:hypothetical protein
MMLFTSMPVPMPMEEMVAMVFPGSLSWFRHAAREL